MARIAQFNTEMLVNGYTPSEAMIYGYLRWTNYKVGGNGDVRPSIGLMEKTLHLSRPTIIRGIQELERRRLIDVDRGYRLKNTYYVNDMRMYPACCDRDDSNWD